MARSDRPEVRAALEFILGPEWSEAQIEDGLFFLSPNPDVDTSVYEDHVRPVAEALREE